MEKVHQQSEFSLSFIKEQLKDLIYKNGKTVRSYNQFFRLYYYIRLLKYANQSQLKSINFQGSSKVATKMVLNKLVKIGHISVADSSGSVYIPNEITDSIVKSVVYNENNFFKVFASLPRGNDTVNDIKNTSVFVEALNKPNYYYLLFPDFDYIRPDALMVLREDRKYKLTFLEIETKQSNWFDRFERMRENYLRLSSDPVVYEYWKKMAQFLRLSIPEIKDFKFSVLIIGNIIKNWGKGFEFRTHI